MPDQPRGKQRLWRSAALRTVAVSGILFLVSAVLLFALLFRTVVATTEGQVLKLAETQARSLARSMDQDEPGLPEGGWPVAKEEEVFRVVLRPDGRALLNELPLRSRPLGPIVADPHQLANVLVNARQLDDSGLVGFGLLAADGSYVFVGHEDEQVSEIRESMIEVISIGAGLVIVLYALVGLLLARRSFARISRMSEIAEDVMGGNLARRMPVSANDDEIDFLASQVNRMLATLERMVSTIRQVSTDIAHDMRTPLTRLQQRLDSADREHDDGRRGVLISQAREDANDALEIFAAMLRIAQIESGSARANFFEFDLSSMLRELFEVYEPVFRDGGRVLTCKVAEGVRFAGDRALLQQLFVNLLENAATHTSRNSTTSLELDGSSRSWLARVRDNGAGVQPNQRDAIFDRFYRGEASRSTPGSGLGLALVKAIADAHELRVTLEDPPGFSLSVRKTHSAR